MKPYLLLAAAGSLLALLSQGARAQDLFSFENKAGFLGQSIIASPTVAAAAPSVRTLTLSQTGQSGNGSGTSGFAFLNNNPGGVVAFGNNLSGIAVGNAGDLTTTNTQLETLTLTFGQSLTALTFQFVTYPVTANGLIELRATSNTGLVSTSAGTANLNTGNNEGFLTLTGSAFTSVTLALNSGASALSPGDVLARAGDTFIVDSFVATPSVVAVPEPGNVALLVGTALPLVWSLRRRVRSRCAG